MTPFMPTVTLSPDALVRIEGGEVITWAECERRLLAARTPVVPVEVGREEIANWICETPCRPGCSSWQGAASRNRCDCDRDAILAALRPTDTGREG